MKSTRFPAIAISAIATALGTAYPQLSTAQTGAATAAPQQVEEVVVSASRIERAGFIAPTPTTVVGAQEFQTRAAVTVADVLYELPQATPSPAGIGGTGAGLNAVNLRNLGSARSLVLVDGRRAVATNRNGTVDTNLVPTVLVQRLEVVTGGASAAWGSDAVAGVANIVFKKKLERIEGSFQTGTSQRGDNKTISASIGSGFEFADGRGQFMAAGEFSNLNGVPRYADRDWGRRNQGFVTQNIGGLIYQNVPAYGLSFVNFTAGGVITGASTTLTAGGAVPASLGNATTNTSTVFGPGGVAQLLQRSIDPPVTVNGVLVSGTSGGNFAVGGYGVFPNDQDKIAANSSRGNFYARSTYDLTPDVEAFGELSFSNTQNSADLRQNLIPGGTGPIQAITLDVRRTAGVYNNPYVAAAVAAGLVLPANLQTITLSRLSNDLGIATNVTNTRVKRGVLGLKGEFHDWKWSTYYTHGESVYDSKTSNNIIQTRFHAAINVVNVGGVARCNPASIAYGLLSPAEQAACVPANPFGPNSFTQAVRDYVNGTLSEVVTSKQDAAGFSVQGDPLTLWAGKVSVATGIEYRKESITDVTDPVSNLSIRTVDFGITEAGGYAYANPKSFNGQYTVKELFSEAVIPLLKDLPGAKSLEANAAARRTVYSTSGGVTSWKVGLGYQPMTGLLFRATRSHDIRAPSLNELYTGANTAAGAVLAGQDPLLPTQAYSYSTIAGGNPALTPEIGTTKTIGVTWTPSYINGLSASVDFFKIAIENSIGTFGAQNIIDACGNGVIAIGTSVTPGQASDPLYCSRITRVGGPNTATQIISVNNSGVNIGERLIRGYDVELGYRFRLASLWSQLGGVINTRLLATVTRNDITTPIAGRPASPDVMGTVNNPRYRASYSVGYQNGPYSANIEGQYRPRTRIVLIEGVPSATTVVTNTYAPGVNNIPARYTLNGSLQYTVYDSEKGRLQIFGNINNLFDRDPVPAYATGVVAYVPAQTGSDFIGRNFVAGLRFTY